MTTNITSDAIEWRDSELDDVVAVLDEINPKGYSAENIKYHAWREFERDGYQPTWLGTAGWYVSIVLKSQYKRRPWWEVELAAGNGEKPFIAMVSLMGYSVRKSLPREVAKQALGIKG